VLVFHCLIFLDIYEKFKIGFFTNSDAAKNQTIQVSNNKANADNNVANQDKCCSLF